MPEMYWTAFALGFLGSFHCIGMCGPIVLALPNRSVVHKFLYNIGRIITYSVLGAVIGLLGKSFVLVGWQQFLSIAVGIVMLIIILFTKYKRFDLPLTGLINNIYSFVKAKLAPLFKNESIVSPLLIGILNGLLPCGLVYAAMFAALSMGSVVGGSYYMIFFGVGTIPIMLVLGIFSGFITPPIRSKLNRAVPYFLALVAILLILRGMNLGIPYISPQFDNSGQLHMHHNM
jgi:uncharacterized protein